MADEPQYPLLDAIRSPADLRKLPAGELEALAAELRTFLIQTVATRGGHFAAGLGTVELTIALHYVYDTPVDRIVWDVGHQAYPHKVLTGRRERLHTIKQTGGLAPFPSRAESVFDTFGVGHSSTSISAALGMAIGAARAGEKRRVVAVIGDGAMSAGLAFEALNHAGSLDVDLLVILNDNDMSISENVGALSNYFAKVLSGKLYAGLREGSKKVLRQMPTAWELARRSEEHMKGMVLPGTMFEEMGWNYIGPIDGHDLKALTRTLRNLKGLHGPQLLHIATRKGKGYPPAEADPIKWHGPGPFDPVSGTIYKEKASGPTYSQVFGQWLCDIAERDARIVGITPAMREGSGLVEFEKRFPERYFDVAIAEQHAVTFAAGLACEGARPVVAIYSTFLQRGYDQLIHDVALQKLPVLFAIDRAGLVGGDGVTHQGNYDLSYLRCIPNMVVMAPADENECRQMLYTATTLDQPAAVRYPRGQGPGVAIQEEHAGPTGRPRSAATRRTQRPGNPRVWNDGRTGRAYRRTPRCHACQHAVHQAAGRRSGGTACRASRGVRHHRRERDRRRRRCCGRGTTRRAQHTNAAPASWNSRPIRGARLARRLPENGRARSGSAGGSDRPLLATVGARARRTRLRMRSR